MFLNGLRNEIVNANSYYDDPFDTYGHFDYVMANPPFNVDDVNLDKVKCQKRFSEYGIPQNKSKKTGKAKDELVTVPNANYLWINLFATALKPEGRAALVMPNSASDARNTEADIRQRLIESGIINCMLSLPRNMFYTVTLPATLWFFDKARMDDKHILFIDARNIFRQIDRAHREFTPEQIRNIACIRHLYQGDTDYMVRLLAQYDANIADLEKAFAEAEAKHTEAKTKADEWFAANKGKRLQPALNKELQESEEELNDAKSDLEYMKSQRQWLTDRFPDGVYTDVTGLCKVASLEDIKEQDYSLNPGRYVGVAETDDNDEDFAEKFASLHEELSKLNAEATTLAKKIDANFKELMG
jgi:type I restriction enzyme M protein